MIKKRLFLFIIVSLSAIMVACQLDVPIREMVESKKRITQAYEVQADRLSPDLMKKASDHLFSAHEYLKNENTNSARDEAIAANDAANQAIEESLPLLADESLKAAQTLRDKCDMVYAEKYAPEDWKAGLGLLKDAEGLFEQKELWQSHLKSREAEAVLARSIEASLSHKADLTVKQEELSELHKILSGDEYASESKEELAVAASKIAQAGENLSTDHLRDAYLLLEEADASLKSAEGRISTRVEQVRSEILSRKKDELRNRIAGLRNDLALLSSDPGSRFAESHITAADSLLSQAESGIEADPDTSSTQCDAAHEKISAARGAILSGALLERADTLDNERVKLNSEPNAEKVQEKLDNAALMISDGRALAQTSSYQESASKLENAQELLIAVKTELDSITQDQEIKPEPEKTAIQLEKKETPQERIYVVKYNPKNRDCLWKIAAYEYGNPRLWPLIYVANRDVIKDPDLIFPGQKLVIPSVPEKPKDVEPATESIKIPLETPSSAEPATVDAPQEAPQP